MPRKAHESKSEEGAPLWMVTYGDMMTLLLCFFVMLVALSEVKTEEFYRMLDSMRRAFGYSGAASPRPGGSNANNSPFDRIAYFERIRGKHMHQGESDQRGQAGPYSHVQMVRDGEHTLIGTRVGFARASADLSEEGREGLVQIADLLRGHPNKIEVRGHTSRQALPRGRASRDKWDLAFARARAVADFLVKNDIATERIRMVSCADTEPLRETYQTGQRWRNRRVEVLMMEATTDQFVQPAAPDDLTRRSNGGSNRG